MHDLRVLQRFPQLHRIPQRITFLCLFPQEVLSERVYAWKHDYYTFNVLLKCIWIIKFYFRYLFDITYFLIKLRRKALNVNVTVWKIGSKSPTTWGWQEPGNEFRGCDVSWFARRHFVHTVLFDLHHFSFVSHLFTSKDEHWVMSYPLGVFQIWIFISPRNVKSFLGSVSSKTKQTAWRRGRNVIGEEDGLSPDSLESGYGGEAVIDGR